MEIEPLNTMNESLYLSLLMIKVIMLMTIFFVIAALAIYVVGTAWLCFKERRQSRPAPRKAGRALPPNPWMSMTGVPDAPGLVSRPCGFLAPATSATTAKAAKAGSIGNPATRI